MIGRYWCQVDCFSRRLGTVIRQKRVVSALYNSYLKPENHQLTLVAVAPQTIGTSSNPFSRKIGDFWSEQEVWTVVEQALKILTAAKAAAVNRSTPQPMSLRARCSSEHS